MALPISDDFNRADASDLGADWEIDGFFSSAGVYGNVAASPNVGWALHKTATGQADYSVSIDVLAPVPYQLDGPEVGVWVRADAVATQTGYQAWVQDLGTGFYAITLLDLYNFAQVGSGYFEVPDTPASLRVDVEGDTITVWWNGVVVIQEVDATYQTGQYAGIVLGTADNFLVQEIPVAGGGDYPISLDAGSYAVTGYDVGLTVGRVLSLDAGSYTVTGNATGLTVARILSLDAGAYGLTGNDVTLSYTPANSYTLVADAGEYAITGLPVSLTVARVLNLDAGTYTTTGQDASLLVGRVIALDSGSYALTGQAIAFLIARLIEIDTGSYGVTGYAVGLYWSGEEIPETPAERVFVVPLEDRIFVVPLEDRIYHVGG